MKTEYVPFNPARKPEEYIGQPGRHNGLALPHDTIEAIGRSRLTGQAHPFLVRGEWRREDGARWLDIAIDSTWVGANTNYKTVDGRLRWTCPECGKLSDAHGRGCGYGR